MMSLGRSVSEFADCYSTVPEIVSQNRFFSNKKVDFKGNHE